MSEHIYRSHSEPIRQRLSFERQWRGSDEGLIKCWEVGRELAEKKSTLANRAKNGELPILPWKGGVEKKIKKKEKYAPLKYLAEWQGLRGDDLDIDLSEERRITCSKTGMQVIYTNDATKYIDP